MDTDNLRYFTDTEEKVADILMQAGFRRNYARVLVFLFKNNELTSRDIERGTDLRQPEVSIAINYLLKKQWAQITSQISENKGRPVKIYQLTSDIDTILDEIESIKREELQEQIDLIEEAREIIKNQDNT